MSLGFVLSPRTLPVTGPAFATSAIRTPIGVLGIVRMTLWAMRDLCSLCRDALASKQVNATGNSLKVRGIHAGSVSAQMVKIQSFGNWPFGQFVGNSMGSQQSRLAHELPVPLAIKGRNPRPATIGIAAVNLFPEAFSDVQHPYFNRAVS